MLKKLVILGIVGFVAVSIVKGSKVGSYIRSEIDAMKARCEASIPPEKEISRLRNEIKQLDKDILAVVNQLAKERAEVNQLKDKIGEVRAQQGKDKELLNSHAAAIKAAVEKAANDKDGTVQVTFADTTTSIAVAKADLEAGVKRFTANQKALEGMETALTTRVKVKETLEKQFETMKNQKRELTVAVDSLEAELTALKLQQMESKYQTDDTRLGKIKEDIRSLRTKIEVEKEKLKLLPAVYETPSKASSNKSVDDIMAPLSGATGNGAVKSPVIE